MTERPLVFLDTSVWIAAILSDRGASHVIVERARRDEILVASAPDVFEEATRNLKAKYPGRLSAFVNAFELIHPYLFAPSKKTVLHAATIVHLDDAPILAAAIEAKTEYLITLDRKHFLSQAREIERKTGMRVIAPGAFLRVRENS